jgi:hypothetical protein
MPRGRAAKDTPAKLAKRYEPLVACGPAAQQGPDSRDGPWKKLLRLTALVALLSVSNETKAQVYDYNRRGCAALPAGQTVKREGGFNSQRKIVEKICATFPRDSEAMRSLLGAFGAVPADLPVQRHTKLRLVLNLKAAEALGMLRLREFPDLAL